MADGSRDSDTFWPGYVDAISNLVLSLLFIVAILTIAVFMFAMELGRRQVIAGHKTRGQAPASAPAAEARARSAEAQKASLESELRALKLELKTLKASAAKNGNDDKSRLPPKTLTASEKAADPEKDIQAIRARPQGIVIVFAVDAVALSNAEAARAKEALAPIRRAGSAKIEVLIPLGFSEVRRLAFYRAMSVRNLLIELGLPSEKIELNLADVASGGDSARVMVRTR